MANALIGRHAELQRVVDALKQARAGETTTIVVRGEPGIGKSRFLEATLAQAELLGHRVYASRLDDLDRFIPFAALASALARALDEEQDPGLAPVAGEVLAALVAATTGSADAPSAPLPRLVAQLAHVLASWGEREPLVLAIDDLHAADNDTLTVLSLLIRRLQGERVSFLATTRARPPDVSVELAATIERLGRDGLATIVDLGPLDMDEVRALAHMAIDAAPDDRLVHTLWAAANGNPFYVEEGVRSLHASGELIVAGGQARLASGVGTPALRAPTTIVYRLFDLGPDARAVARALTAFRRFELDDLDLLAQLSGLDAPGVEKAFDTLADAQLLRRIEYGFEFVHPIVRDTLYDDLGPAERRRIHGMIAARLTAARAEQRDVSLSDLATHIAASANTGDEQAIAVLVEAARAAATTAPASAAVWYDRALELLPARAQDPRAGELLAEQAKALFLASQLGRATEVTRRALALLPAGRRRATTAALQVTMLTALGRLDEALAESDALVAASPEPIPRLHAERGSLLVLVDRFAEAEAEARRALELAGDDDGARALAYRALSTIAHCRGQVSATYELFEQQLRVAEHLGPAARLSALTTHAMHVGLFGFVGDATALLAEANEASEALGGAALRDALDVTATIVDWQAGRWDEALERVRWLAILPQPAEAWVVLSRSAALAIQAARGNAISAKQHAQEIEHTPIAQSTAAWARALLAAMLGEIDAAVALLERTWQRNAASGRLADAHHILGDLCDLELGRGNSAAALGWTKTMAEVDAGSTAPAYLTFRDRCLALTTADIEAGRNALAVAEEHGLVPNAAYAHLVLGTLGDDPATNLRAAYDTYRSLGAETMRRRTAHAMKAAGIDAPRSRRTARGELSETELKLSQLVHDGLTNREIANVLMISPKTVEVYLSRLFAKTGCASRIELAVAVSEGRIPNPTP